MNQDVAQLILFVAVPLLCIATAVYASWGARPTDQGNKKYRVRLPPASGGLKIENVRRGVSVIGSAGSGKTQSVVYHLLKHFCENGFCGIIHDYKDFEITEMAWPLFRAKQIRFHTIAFDEIHSRVNPIAPHYLHNEESVHEIARVLMENLLEQNLSENRGSNKFFSDAVEGLLCGMIWKMRTAHPQYCTLPHIIALYHSASTKRLAAFLRSDLTARNMAGAFLNGIESEKQTAGVKGTLANALKRIGSKKLFYVLSHDGIPLDINNPQNRAVLSLVNHPQYESAFSPVISMVLHTVTRLMAVRDRGASFLLMEEAPTLKLPNMPRIPATLRSYGIATVYVMQDKVQNDLLYGEKASRAILGNLSYQFFGKVNDPDTAKYYERFFEIVKRPTKSVSKTSGLSWERRITKGEKEVAKRRADGFFRLRPGEFVVFADGRDRKMRFPLPTIQRTKPRPGYEVSDKELALNYKRVYREARGLLAPNK